jgi:hypothetical protein
MDYSAFVKKLSLPDGSTAPTQLTYDDLVATAISREHLTTSSTSSGTDCEFREGDSYTYAVYNAAGTYLGCCYLYPLGRRRPLTAELLAYDVDVSWWVTPAAYENGYYSKLHAALQHWLAREFPGLQPNYSNVEIPTDGS